MTRSGLATMLAAALLGGACTMTDVRNALRSREALCTDYCRLDTDEACGGRRPGEMSTCVAKCTAGYEGPCAAARRALEDCQSAMTCDDYRRRHEGGAACKAERKAHDACRTDAYGGGDPKH